MNIPGFNAEGALGPTVKKYRGKIQVGFVGVDALSQQQATNFGETPEDDFDENIDGFGAFNDGLEGEP